MLDDFTRLDGSDLGHGLISGFRGVEIIIKGPFMSSTPSDTYKKEIMVTAGSLAS